MVAPAEDVEGVGGVVDPPDKGYTVYHLMVLPADAVALNGDAVSFKQ